MQSRTGAHFLFGALPWLLAAGATPATAAQGAPQVESAGSPAAAPAPDAAEVYDKVGEQLRALDKAMFDGLATDADDPQAMYLATGIADERMTRWLKSARQLGDQLIEASRLPYQRTIDPQDGFTLGPAHLAPLRTTGRSLAILIHDAALTGDRDRLAELLRVQITIAIRTAGEGTIPSSISAINTMQEHMRAVEGLLGCGMLDAPVARKLLEARAPLATVQDFGASAATRAELEALQIELDRILLTPLEDRPAAVAGLRITVPVRLDDNAVITARGGALAYMTDVSSALAEPDFTIGRQKLVIAEQRLRDGAFGDLLKALAPQLLPTADLLARSQSELESQRAVLEQLARGATDPAVHADAGWYYQHAARAAMEMPIGAQVAIDALRTATATPTTATVADARRAINAARATVIDPIMRADKSARCSLPGHPAGASGSGLVRSCTEGIHGAVRVVLADAFGAGARPAGAPTRAEAATACLRLAARFAALESVSHSLVAHQVVRDLRQPIKQLAARGELTVAMRTELAAILEELPASDPLGYEAALRTERSWLRSRSFPSGSSAVIAFEAHHIERLTPNQVGFLLAMFTAPAQVPFDAPRGSPLDGALVDIRPWFDLAAFKRACAQFDTVRTRAQRQGAARSADAPRAADPLAAENDSALAWLDVTVPVDIASRIDEAKTDVAALAQLVASPASPAGRARQQANASKSSDGAR